MSFRLWSIGGTAVFVLMSSTVAQAMPEPNLLENGSFESHVVKGSWDLFDEIPGWSLISGPGIELQRGVGGWDAFDGEQWLELDADENGPGGGSFQGETGSSSIMQSVQTGLGQQYLLTISFSARPGVSDNHLIVSWDDEVVIDRSASGTGLSNTVWETITVMVMGSGNLSTLMLGDSSIDDTLGTLVDDVSLVAVNLPAPASLSLLLLPLLTGRRRR
jgi:hypothetical protein